MTSICPRVGQRPVTLQEQIVQYVPDAREPRAGLLLAPWGCFQNQGRPVVAKLGLARSRTSLVVEKAHPPSCSLINTRY